MRLCMFVSKVNDDELLYTNFHYVWKWQLYVTRIVDFFVKVLVTGPQVGEL